MTTNQERTEAKDNGKTGKAQDKCRATVRQGRPFSKGNPFFEPATRGVLAVTGKHVEDEIFVGRVDKVAHWNVGIHIGDAATERSRQYSVTRRVGRRIERGADIQIVNQMVVSSERGGVRRRLVWIVSRDACVARIIIQAPILVIHKLR